MCHIGVSCRYLARRPLGVTGAAADDDDDDDGDSSGDDDSLFSLSRLLSAGRCVSLTLLYIASELVVVVTS